jgi:hypothetical protein
MGCHPASRSPKAATLAVLLTLSVATAVTLTACGNATTAATQSAAPAPASAAAMPTTAAPSASQALPVAVKEFHGMLPVVFVVTLVKERPYRSTKTVEEFVQARHAVWTFRQKSFDPRLSGVLTSVINADQRKGDMSATLWGTSTVRNSGGSWAGPWTGGIAAGGDEHHFYWTAKGTGDYAGLVYHGNGWLTEAGQGFTSDLQELWAGWIETKDGSPVPAAPGPGSTPANWTPFVTIATMGQTGYDSGSWTMDVQASDARVGGNAEGTIVEAGAARSDGSVDYNGVWSVTNEGGAWDSSLYGVRGPGTVEHFQYWTYSGSGAYAGLTFNKLAHFMERGNFVTGDRFIETGWIEEAQ